MSNAASQMLADEVLAEQAEQAPAEGGATTSPLSIGIDAVAMRDFMTVYVKPE